MKRAALVLVPFLVALAACGGEPTPEPATPAAKPAPVATEPEPAPVESAEPAPAASASATPAPEPLPAPIEVTLEAKSGSKLTGTATLTQEEGGVRVKLKLAGVKPGHHGAHIHETGDCSAKDGSSAGGHFNPGKHDHALPESAQHHLGDLGNIEIAKDGTGEIDILVPGANLRDGDTVSFVGRAIIVHDKKDDGGQPVGNAGNRIGCGVIKR